MNDAAPISSVKLLINGRMTDSASEWLADVTNPATQEVLARVPFALTEEIDAAMAAASTAFGPWRRTAISERARIFFKLQQLIREHMAPLRDSIVRELGKTMADAEGDVFRGLEVVEHACSIPNLQMGGFVENVAGGVNTFSMLQPLGVCAGITPFNFPAMIPLWMFPMAIACGNTFVLKPSELDPLTPMMLADLAQQPVCLTGCSTSCTAARSSRFTPRPKRLPSDGPVTPKRVKWA